MKKIIFIETSDIGAAYTANACRKLGFDPLFICDLDNVQGDTRKQLDAELMLGNLINMKSTDALAIAQELERRNISNSEIAGVMTFLDSRLEVAIKLGQKLGCPHQMDKAILSLKSKSYVQQIIPEYSPKTISFHANQIPNDLINNLIIKNGKVLIKPEKTAGAIGTQIFDLSNAQDIDNFISSQQLPEHLNDQKWLCQQYLNGKLYSIEGYCHQGKVSIFGVSNRRKINFTESQIEFPVNEELSDKQRASYETAINCLIERSNFRDGFFHIEFIVNKNDCLIIDANMGRLGGGPLGEMIPLSYGIDTIDFFASIIKITLKIQPEIKVDIIRDSPKRILGLCYGSPISGYFNQVHLPKLRSFNHTLVLNQQQNIEAMGMNNWSWIGIISGYADSIRNELEQSKVEINGQLENLCY